MVSLLSKTNSEEISNLIKKIFFISLSFFIIKYNYDYSISVGAILDRYESFDYLLSILLPTTLLLIIYFLKVRNYNNCIYVLLASLAIFFIDAILLENADWDKLEKFLRYYPTYIFLTYLASIAAELASSDIRRLKEGIEARLDKLIEPITNILAQLITKRTK